MHRLTGFLAAVAAGLGASALPHAAQVYHVDLETVARAAYYNCYGQFGRAAHNFKSCASFYRLRRATRKGATPNTPRDMRWTP